MADISDRSTNKSTDAIEPEAEDAPEVPAEVVPQVPPWKRTRHLSVCERNALYHELLYYPSRALLVWIVLGP